MSTEGEPSYYSPSAAGEGSSASKHHPLASRLSRLGASLVDAFIGLAIGVPIMFMTGYLQRAMEQQASVTETVLYSVGGMVFFLLLHGYFLATRGQTIGKMLLGVRIVNYDTGELLSFAKLIGLRVVPVWLVSSIPMAGGCLALVDTLFIFGSEQRCVHDLIAGTKVVQA
jgi:uncharacterized RDD family membrane protein YckC